MKLTSYERESILNYNVGEQTATLYTGDKAVVWKLDTLVADFSDTYKLIQQMRYLRPIPFRNIMSATASRGQSAQNRGNGQGR